LARCFGGSSAVDFLDAGEEGGFVFGQAAQRLDADRFGHAQQDQAAHGRAGRRCRPKSVKKVLLRRTE
jgi:hypothetical protein